MCGEETTACEETKVPINPFAAPAQEETKACDEWPRNIVYNLQAEKEKLDDKIGRLVSFLKRTEDTPAISQNQRVLLGLQLRHMKNYASCLNLRIADLQANNK